MVRVEGRSIGDVEPAPHRYAGRIIRDPEQGPSVAGAICLARISHQSAKRGREDGGSGKTNASQSLSPRM